MCLHYMRLSYNEDNTIKEFKPKYDDVPSRVKKRFVTNLNKVDFPEKMVVPYI